MSRGRCDFCEKVIYDEPYHDLEKNVYYHTDCHRFRGWIKKNKKKVKEVLNEKD